MKHFIKLYDEAGDGGTGGGGEGGNAAGSGSTGAGGSGSLLAGAGGDSNGGGNAGQQQQAASVGGDPWFVGLYDSSGKLDSTKFDGLPSHLKQHKETFSKYQTVEALLGGMGNLAHLAGRKALAPLPADATDEAKAERAKLMAGLNNTPEKPEGYGFNKPDAVPDSAWDQEYVNGVAGILHKFQASPELAKALMDHDLAHLSKVSASTEANMQAAAAAEMKTLKDTWGNDYSKNLELAVRGAKTAGIDPNDPLFASAKVVMMAAKFAGMVSEDRLVSGQSDGMGGQDDRAKALDIVNNPSNPMYKAYHDVNDPRHSEAVAAKSRLNQSWLAKQSAAGSRTI